MQSYIAQIRSPRAIKFCLLAFIFIAAYVIFFVDTSSWSTSDIDLSLSNNQVAATLSPTAAGSLAASASSSPSLTTSSASSHAASSSSSSTLPPTAPPVAAVDANKPAASSASSPASSSSSTLPPTAPPVAAVDTNKTYKYDLVICTMARSEPFIREWAVRNILAGASHIVLYDNNKPGDDYLVESLRELSERGLVTVVKWELDVTQDVLTKLHSHHDCIRRFRHESKFMTVIDADEIITLDDPLLRFSDFMKRFEPPYHNNVGAIQLYWRVMWCGRHSVLQTHQTLTEHASEYCGADVNVKTIFRVEAYEQIFVDTHYCNLKPGWRTVNALGQDIGLGLNMSVVPVNTNMFIEHHWCKGSLTGFLQKSLRGATGDTVNPHRFENLIGFMHCSPSKSLVSTVLGPQVRHVLNSLTPLPPFKAHRGRTEHANHPMFQFLLKKYDQKLIFDSTTYLQQQPDAAHFSSPLAHFVINQLANNNTGVWIPATSDLY